MKKKSDPEVKHEGKQKLMLQLFVSGMSPKSMEAIKNINRVCHDHFQDCFELEIIDIYKNPAAAIEHHIVFSPSLIKRLPLPKKTLIGTLSETDKVVKALQLNFSEDL
jgi:circadian clock protein KaiB